MKTTVRTLHFVAEIALLKFLDKKIRKIGQYCPKTCSADILLKRDIVLKNHDKVCRIFVMGSGKKIQVIKRGNSFEEAITSAANKVIELFGTGGSLKKLGTETKH